MDGDLSEFVDIIPWNLIGPCEGDTRTKFAVNMVAMYGNQWEEVLIPDVFRRFNPSWIMLFHIHEEIHEDLAVDFREWLYDNATGRYHINDVFDCMFLESDTDVVMIKMEWNPRVVTDASVYDPPNVGIILVD